ncbi:MAG TPA: alpha/beta hydrolase [Frankiaceae bacterium]|nr:alpha/beta hydrolase [Frankiaceae bacterium]
MRLRKASSKPGLRRYLAVAAAGTLAGGAAAGLTYRRSPVLQQEVREAKRFVGKLPVLKDGPVVPPPTPPGQALLLPGRGEIFVRDSGPVPGHPDAPTVLLLHGWTASADLNFFPLYGPLAERYRVIGVDHRGHGRGMRTVETFTLEDCADDAAAVLRELGIDRAIVLGYSMGGPIALLLAQRHPDLVTALVPQATALEWRGTFYERTVWKGLAFWELGRRFGTFDIFVERVVREAVKYAPEVEPYAPWLVAEFRRGFAKWLAQAGRALSEFDARPFASSLGVPAVMCVTTTDRLVRPHKQRQLAEALRAEVIEIRGDHGVPVMRGTRYAKATLEAIDKVAEAAGLFPFAVAIPA